MTTRSNTRQTTGATAPTGAAPPAGQVSTGPVMVDHYRLIRELGRGTGSIVYEAEDTYLGRHVALKVLRAEELEVGGRVSLERFRREAQILARLTHPNVVAVYGVGMLGRLPYIVMELVLGSSAAAGTGVDNGMDPLRATHIIRCAAQGLAAAHDIGVVHRDIKPGNILLGERGEVKVTDFGLARLVDAHVANLTEPGQTVGTPQYMSPEQCCGQPADPRSDIYSLGATFFRLLTGKAPFYQHSPLVQMYKHVGEPHPDPRTIRSDVPPLCVRVVDRAMEKDPARRFRSMAEMAESLRAIESSLTRDAETRARRRSVAKPGMDQTMMFDADQIADILCESDEDSAQSVVGVSEIALSITEQLRLELEAEASRNNATVSPDTEAAPTPDVRLADPAARARVAEAPVTPVPVAQARVTRPTGAIEVVTDTPTSDEPVVAVPLGESSSSDAEAVILEPDSAQTLVDTVPSHTAATGVEHTPPAPPKPGLNAQFRAGGANVGVGVTPRTAAYASPNLGVTTPPTRSAQPTPAVPVLPKSAPPSAPPGAPRVVAPTAPPPPRPTAATDSSTHPGAAVPTSVPRAPVGFSPPPASPPAVSRISAPPVAHTQASSRTVAAPAATYPASPPASPDACLSTSAARPEPVQPGPAQPVTSPAGAVSASPPDLRAHPVPASASLPRWAVAAAPPPTLPTRVITPPQIPQPQGPPPVPVLAPQGAANPPTLADTITPTATHPGLPRVTGPALVDWLSLPTETTMRLAYKSIQTAKSALDVLPQELRRGARKIIRPARMRGVEIATLDITVYTTPTELLQAGRGLLSAGGQLLAVAAIDRSVENWLRRLLTPQSDTPPPSAPPQPVPKVAAATAAVRSPTQARV